MSPKMFMGVPVIKVFFSNKHNAYTIPMLRMKYNKLSGVYIKKGSRES